MQVREAAVAQPQSRRRHVTDERLDLVPRHERLIAGPAVAQRARQVAGDASAQARVDTSDSPDRFDTGQLDVAGGDEARRVDVDDAPPDYVRAQQHLVGAAFELREVHLRRRKVRAARLEARDVADRDEQAAAADDRS
jgi:hypothetical protein